MAKTAIEKLETLKDIMEERDSLMKQLENSKHELKTLKVKNCYAIFSIKIVFYLFKYRIA